MIRRLKREVLKDIPRKVNFIKSIRCTSSQIEKICKITKRELNSDDDLKEFRKSLLLRVKNYIEKDTILAGKIF